MSSAPSRLSVATRDAWRAAQRTASSPLPADLPYQEALRLREDRRAAVAKTRVAFDQAVAAIREHDNPDFLSPVVRLQDLAAALTTGGFGPDQALVYLAAGPDAGLALILLTDEHGTVEPIHLPLPALTESAVSDLRETFASHAASDAETGDEERLISGGFAQAQMGWGFENLQAWGATCREALATLPPTSGFAQALLHLRTAWESEPDANRRGELLALLDLPFATLAEDQRATLAAGFGDALLRVELGRCLPALGHLGLSALAQYLRALPGRHITRLTLVPYGRLALFPLPATEIHLSDAPNGTDETRRLGDSFELSIAPSARSYSVALARAAQAGDPRRQQPDGSTRGRTDMLAIGNPLPLPFGMTGPGTYIGSLEFAAAEADALGKIARKFGYAAARVRTFIGREAKRAEVLAALKSAWYAHLATHGQFNPRNPRRSHVVLSGDEHTPEEQRVLSLGECLDGTVSLYGLRLLVLSACETSLIEVRRAADEVVGLPASFLQAGAAGVIASLWPVYDHATFLLMCRFLQLWLDPALDWPPARCLAEAQRWLREEATNAVIEDYDPTRPISEEAPAAHAKEHHRGPEVAARPAEAEAEAVGARLLRSLRFTEGTALQRIRRAAQLRDDPNGLPYADPIYWAAFTLTGC